MAWNIASGKPRMPRPTILRPAFYRGAPMQRLPQESMVRGIPQRSETKPSLKRQIDTLTERITSARVIAKAIVAAEQRVNQMDDARAQAKAKQPRAGSEFFALADDMEASGRRLDGHARTLKTEMAATEKLAAEVVQEKIVQQQTARDFINRMRGTAEELRDNGGPPMTADSAGSVESSKEPGT